MCCQTTCLTETLETYVTLKWLFLCMFSNMISKISFRCKHFIAVLTFEHDYDGQSECIHYCQTGIVAHEQSGARGHEQAQVLRQFVLCETEELCESSARRRRGHHPRHPRSSPTRAAIQLRCVATRPTSGNRKGVRRLGRKEGGKK